VDTALCSLFTVKAGIFNFFAVLINSYLGQNFVQFSNKFTPKHRLSNVGRKPFDAILMFELILLQKLFNLSDKELEFQVNDRLSFMKFLHLGFEDSIPDATTV